jgi:hypothetical protein
MQFDPLRAFPYPVLRPDVDDYTDGEIQATVDIKSAANGLNIKASINFALSVPEITNLINKKQANYTVVFECRDTYFRHAERSFVPSFECAFPKGSLRGEVVINPYVIASENIKNFSSSLVNSEFGPGPFHFSQGSVLAVDRPQSVYIDRDVFSPISSVFVLVPDENLTGHEWQVKLSFDKVHIAVSPDLKATIDSARNTRKNQAILINSIYFAAVMQCVSNLKRSNADFESYKWSRIIERKCHNLGLDLENHDEYAITQKLMKYPFSLVDNYVFKEGA